MTSDAVLLHRASSAQCHTAKRKSRDWAKRKKKEAKKKTKRERVTFFAPQYDLGEPLLEQFVSYMAAECAEKTSTDFIEVSGSRCHALT